MKRPIRMSSTSPRTTLDAADLRRIVGGCTNENLSSVSVIATNENISTVVIK